MMRGVAYMVIAIALLSTMDAMAKWLAMRDVPVIQILALRSVVIIPLLIVVFLCRGRLSDLKPKNMRLHAYSEYLLLIALALFAVCGHYFMTMAFATAEASLIAPFEYTAILWAIAFDLVVWQTIPSATTGVGAIIIIASGSYIAHRERIRKSPTQQALP